MSDRRFLPMDALMEASVREREVVRNFADGWKTAKEWKKLRRSWISKDDEISSAFERCKHYRPSIRIYLRGCGRAVSQYFIEFCGKYDKSFNNHLLDYKTNLRI